MAGMLGLHYGSAYLMPEIEGPGVSALDALRDMSYPMLGRRETYDKIGQRTTQKLGWSTNSMSRPTLFNEIREHLALEGDGARFHDHRLAEQMLKMYLDANMREDAPSGEHDDYVMAWGIALMGRRYALASGFVKSKEEQKTLSPDEVHWKQFEQDCNEDADVGTISGEDSDWSDEWS